VRLADLRHRAEQGRLRSRFKLLLTFSFGAYIKGLRAQPFAENIKQTFRFIYFREDR
jgi:hypothetical protein